MFAIVDLETTGGSPKTGKIIEVAIVIHNGKRVIEDYSTLVNPLEPINPFITALTGISNDMVSAAPTFDEIADEIYNLTYKRIFIAHNARFDYGFLKQEYRRLGRNYQRQHLCTVKLSKKILPGHNSYSLGRICEDLEIPITNRHRALGDALATSVLFEKLLFTDKGSLIEQLLKDELAETKLPAHLNRKKIEDLPEETGVYYFLDEKGNKLYIGKSRNIRQRVITHFSSDLKSARFRNMKEQIHDIQYELTGSEIIAELLEAGEIKRFMPAFNKAQRRKKYRYGVYHELDDNCYYGIYSALINPNRKPLMKFTSKRWADRAITDLYKKHNIHPALKQVEDSKTYNNKVEAAIKQFSFSQPNFFLVSEGRTFGEKSVIQVENGAFIGYGYFDEDVVIDEAYQLAEFIEPNYDAPDKQKIIRKYLKKKKTSFKVVPYDVKELVS